MVRIEFVGLIAAILLACEGESVSSDGVALIDASGASADDDGRSPAADAASDSAADARGSSPPDTTESSNDIGVGPNDGSAAEHDAAPVTTSPLPPRPDRFPAGGGGDADCSTDNRFCHYSGAADELAIVFIESAELIVTPRRTHMDYQDDDAIDHCYSARAALQLRAQVVNSTRAEMEGDVINIYVAASTLSHIRCDAWLFGYSTQEPQLNCLDTDDPLFVGASTMVALQQAETPTDWWISSDPAFLFGNPGSGAVEIPDGYCTEYWPNDLTTWERVLEEREACTAARGEEWNERLRSTVRRATYDRGLHSAAACMGPAEGADPLPCPNGQSDCPDDLVCNGGLVCVTQELGGPRPAAA